ncbi:glycylpeptide N-tetradecanoyltransferase, partial [Tremellales sp. Uapishka_1]
MPLPTEGTLPVGAPASTSQLEGVPQDILEKFATLGQEAKAEEDEEDEDEQEEGGDEVLDDEGGDAGGDDKKKKKKKKKKKGKAGKIVDRLKIITTGQAPQEIVDVIRENMQPDAPQATDEEIRRALKAMDLMKILDGKAAIGNKIGTKDVGEHKFWQTQPVPQLPKPGSSSAQSAMEEGPIDSLKTPTDVKQEPGALPAGYVWTVIDVKDESQVREVYELLSENYVEDDDAMFRFKYSKEFLLWVLTTPGYVPEWHVGVRVAKTGKLIAFISGIKIELRVRSKVFDAAEINFLCVHKKLRSKRLAPVLIKEVTRKCNLANVWQAIYTAGAVLPTPFGVSRYYHRNLNPPKLVDIGFSPLPRSMTIARLVKQYSLPSHPRLPGFREMVLADVPQVASLLRRYLARFEIAQTFGKDEEVEHWFLSGQGREENGKRVEQVIWSYVVEDPTTRLVTDMISFYSLPSTIMQHKKHDILNAAYLFYYASDVIFSPGGSADDVAAHEVKAKNKLAERLNALTNDAMIIAQNAGFDVMNALTVMDNNIFLNEQKFGPGDGFLNCELFCNPTSNNMTNPSSVYLYNWACAPIDGGGRTTAQKQSAAIGVVML